MKNKRNNELAVCGFAAVKVLEKNNAGRIQRLYFTKDRAPLFGGLCKKLAAEKKPYNQVSDASELEKLCGSVHHQGVVAMIEMPVILPLNTDITAGWVERNESAVILDRIGNANNFGAIVRSAAFFGIKNIVISLDDAQSSITTSSYRVAEGGMEYVNIYTCRSIPNLLRDMKGRMVSFGTSLNAKKSSRELRVLKGEKGALVVLGNEENGIGDDVQKLCDHLIIIKGGNVDSLNVAQASSVILYELSGN